MNFKTTVILLVLLVAAAAFVMYDKLSTGDKEKAEASSDPKKLFDVKNKDDVTSLTVKSADGSEIVLSKTENKWRMTKPVDAAAEGWQVDSLVSSLIDLQSKFQVDPKDKGLDKPKLNVEIAAKGGKLLKFAVGDKTQLGDLYIKVEGHSQADVVNADLYDRLSKPANELRDKQIVTASASDIKQFSIATEGQKLVLQKAGANWELVEPKKLPADEGAVNDILNAITNLRAADWIAKDSPEVATAKIESPQMTVSFTTAAPATQPTTTPASQPVWTTLTLGQYENIRHQKVYARISDTPALMKVAPPPIDALTKKPIELREKKLADINPDEVSKISIVTDLPAGPAPTTKPARKTQVDLERRPQVAEAPATTKPATTQATQPATTQATKPVAPPAPEIVLSTWELKSDPKGEADDEAVRNLLAELHPLRATRFHETTPTTKPTATYTLKLTTQGPGGAAAINHEIKLIDSGNDQNISAEYNGLSFDLPKTFTAKIEGNFAKKPKESPKPTPDDFKGPGEK